MKQMRNIAKKILWSIPSSFILMFHHVTDCPEYTKSSCMMKTENFYKCIDLLDNYDSLKNIVKNPGEKKIAVTFDDGLSDLYTIAYPYLKSKKIPFTVFIATELLDTPGYITTAQLIEMSMDELVTVGSHGITHKILTELTDDEKKYEIRESKKILESLIKKDVFCFAYSHGQYDAVCQKYACVYDFCVSTVKRPLNFLTKGNKKGIPRINITDSTLEIVKEICSKQS